MSARYSVLLALALLGVHLDYSRAVKCYRCHSGQGYDGSYHPDCMQGSKDMPTCEDEQCYAQIDVDGKVMQRSCGRKEPTITCAPHKGIDGVMRVDCGCDTDLCNNWEPATLKAKAATSSIPYHIAIAVVGAKMIACF
ncbi:unnamed protein product, partial [Mesorhabditis spiculigera]